MAKDTKTRIVEAAVSLFGENGFDATSVREICSKAGANNAAINYHFGDKRGLYRSVLQHLLEKTESLSFQPVTGTAEERLRLLVERSLADVFRDRSEGNEKLIFREIAEPTDELMSLIRDPLCGIFQSFLTVVRELCPSQVDNRKLELIVLSIFGQVDYYRMFHRFVPELVGQEAADSLDLETLTEHITEFSLAAIEKLRKP